MTKTSGKTRKKALPPVQIIAPAAQLAPAETLLASAPKPKTKAALLRDMLETPGGATAPSLMAATGWQPHTVRAALSGLRKSGCALERRSGADGPVYEIVKAGPSSITASTGSDNADSSTCVDQDPAMGSGSHDNGAASSPDDASGQVDTPPTVPIDAAPASSRGTASEPHS